MDEILARFLKRQYEESRALAAQSDLLDIVALDAPAQHYIATFHCKGLVRDPDGAVSEADTFHLGIWMSDEHLRSIAPLRIITWLAPLNVFHPQIRPPYMCLGRLVAGVSLVEILFQAWEVITYRKVTMREDDALNLDACVWARHNQHRFPVDSRSLKRRPVEFSVESDGVGK